MALQSIKHYLKTIQTYSIKELSFRFFETLKIKFNNPQKISSITKVEGAGSSNDISIVLIVKNEARYIREWLEYHFLIGIDHVYIYDNGSTDDIRTLLTPYIKKGFVTYILCPGKRMQIPAYNDAIARFGKKNRWMGFVDADEFIVLHDKSDIHSFFKDFDKESALGINWIMYDSNGHQTIPSNGFVLSNFNRIYKDDNTEVNHNFKSFVKPNFVKLCTNPHFVWLKKGVTVNENKVPLTTPIAQFNSTSKIQINHYFSKSKEEYVTKINRGCADSHPTRPYAESDFDFTQSGTKYSQIDFSDILKRISQSIPDTYGE